mmetsp:Transcript_58800/g.174956  ORF Transcript_58800/g.174956 Transcript_58800/m.174956 type:complete len:260 (-) Transcript_58800:447-1226(-)
MNSICFNICIIMSMSATRTVSLSSQQQEVILHSFYIMRGRHRQLYYFYSALMSLLDLESARTTTSTGFFELTSLGPNVWLDRSVRVGIIDSGAVTKVGEGFTVLRAPKENRVTTLWCTKCKLIESDALATRSHDALPCSIAEVECADGKFRAFEHAHVISHLSDNYRGLAILVLHELSKAGNANGGGIDTRHVKAPHNRRTEVRIRPTRKEFVELDQETLVWVLSLDLSHRAPMPNTAPSGLQVNTHFKKSLLSARYHK